MNEDTKAAIEMDGPLPDNLVEAWQQFLGAEHRRETDQLLCYELFDDGTLFPLQRKEEMRKMLRIAAYVSPEIVMEIGADKGGGLYHWCKLPTVNKVIGCEIRGTPYSRLFEKAFPHIQFLWIPYSSYSQTTLFHVEDWLCGSCIDCLFIDGDKSNFELDFDSYYPLMCKRRGIVFMHDITDRNPGEAYERIITRGYHGQTIINRSDTEQAIQRMDMGLPVANGYEGWLRHWRGRSCGVGVIYLDTTH